MVKGKIQDEFLNIRGKKEKIVTFQSCSVLLDGQSNNLGDIIKFPQFLQILKWMILDNSLLKFESTDIHIFLQIIHIFSDRILLDIL